MNDLAVLVVVLAVAGLALPIIPGRIAAAKGRSFAGFYVAGLFCFFPAVIVALAISAPTIRPGDIIRVRRRVDLDDGGTIPEGHASKVLDVDVIQGQPVVLVRGPQGTDHWISMKAAGGGGSGRQRAEDGPPPGWALFVVRVIGALGTTWAIATGVAVVVFVLSFSGSLLVAFLSLGVIGASLTRVVVGWSSTSPEPSAAGERARRTATGDSSVSGHALTVSAPRSPPGAARPGDAPSRARRADRIDPFEPSTHAALQFELTALDPGPDVARGRSPLLGITYDLKSWLPYAEAWEQPRAAYVLSMVVFDPIAEPPRTAWRGKSTMLVTDQRLVGVCPQGETRTGAIGVGAGNVGVWTIRLADLVAVRAGRDAGSDHAVLRGPDGPPRMMIASPRVLLDGSMQPADLQDVIDIINHAARTVSGP